MLKKQLNPPFSLSSLEGNLDRLSLGSTLYKKHQVYFSSNLFQIDNPTLKQVLKGRSALFAISKTIYSLYGDQIKKFLNQADFASKIVIVETGENNKNLINVASICHEANNFCLSRNHPIVCIGGGICLDIGGLAAALFRRGVPHIKIPTTFVGLIDAGIATKNGVNLENKKNLLGTFYPPEATIIDPTFLKTLNIRDIACGTSESLKMGLIASKKLYKLWLNYGVLLQNSKLQDPNDIAYSIMELSINSMLDELSNNLYEHNSYQRSVDFGHTFSPYIEQISQYQILHGEAVAIDMAISCQISHTLGLLTKNELEEILNLFESLHLPIYDSCIEIENLWKSLTSIVAHRGGNLNLVVPKGIGDCKFLQLDDISPLCLTDAISKLEEHYEQSRPNTVVC